MKINCGHCFYYESDEFECRRYPPKVITKDSMDGESTVFPVVEDSWWCGEWKPHNVDVLKTQQN